MLSQNTLSDADQLQEDFACFSASSHRFESLNPVYGAYAALEHILAFSSSEVESYQVSVLLEALNFRLFRELRKLDAEFLKLEEQKALKDS